MSATMTTTHAARDGERNQYSRLVDWMNVLKNSPSQELTVQSSAVVAIPKDRSRMPPPQGNQDALLVLLPLLIVLSTFLFLLLLFLVCVLLLRRRRGILLRDSDGPIDMSREELIDGEGGFEGVESRWLESVDEETRRAYLRAKDYQTQSPPNSLPTDITLSQFLAIQEKGVSAWSFEPDYEILPSLLVHARTELTFLPDPSSSSSVQSNLPLPKLNEVYYWEVKMFDLPLTTHVSVGLATKPYPSFRLPGHNRFSVAYHSSGDKSHNYPFTQGTFGSVLKEGDVLGVGYRPRSGTVFFTRNGRKLEDAFVGLTKWNLFPTVGADGPCSVHVNLGQSGFVFIEANVKKWGLAPSVGTLAPPPAYGAERGSILLEAGGERRRPATPPPAVDVPSSSMGSPRRTHRSRRPKPPNPISNQPIQPSPLRGTPVNSIPLTPPPPITPIPEEASPSSYISPTDLGENNVHLGPHLPPTPPSPVSPFGSTNSSRPSSLATLRSSSRTRVPELQATASTTSDSDLSDPDSPQQPPNPPTPNHSDIHMRPISGRNTPTVNSNDVGNNLTHSDTPRHAAVRRSRRSNNIRSSTIENRSDSRFSGGTSSNLSTNTSVVAREPPAYSPLDAYHYPDGVHVDLPADVIAAALGASEPATARYEAQSANTSTSPPPGSQRTASGQRRGSSRRSRRH
ncbi:SPRY-domain-containing protein [Ramaria rubella]|nr:SPRY-domain-containing protein [Ramaria rubella]